jgi:hypothetical protein
MRQPWSPQSKNGFAILHPGFILEKVPLFEPNCLLEGMRGEIYFKIYLIAEYHIVVLIADKSCSKIQN